MTVRPRGQSSDLLAGEDGHRGTVHAVGQARAAPELGRLHRCQCGRHVCCTGPVLGGQGQPSVPLPRRRQDGGFPALPPSSPSRAVADSRPVERRFPCRNRVPGQDKSRCNLLRLQAAPAARAGAAGQSPRRDGAWGRDWKRKNLLENQPCSNGEASLTSGALQSRTPPSMTLRVSFQSPERGLCSAASAGSWEGPEGAGCSRISGLAMGGTRRLHALYVFILQKW